MEIEENKQKEACEKIQGVLRQQFPDISFSCEIEEEWIDVLIDESRIPLMDVLSYLQGQLSIYDVRLEEISTESVIKKIYENNEKGR